MSSSSALKSRRKGLWRMGGLETTKDKSYWESMPRNYRVKEKVGGLSEVKGKKLFSSKLLEASRRRKNRYTQRDSKERDKREVEKKKMTLSSFLKEPLQICRGLGGTEKGKTDG